MRKQIAKNFAAFLAGQHLKHIRFTPDIKYMRRLLVRSYCLLLLLLIGSMSQVWAQACVGGHNYSENQTTPFGLANFLIMSSEETFNAPGFSSIVSGGDFDSVIMGRNPTEIQDQKDLAVAYFLSYYGVDFSLGDTTPDGKWQLFNLAIPDEYNQRIIYAGDETVPPAGWLAHQGFYRMIAVPGFEPHTLYGVWGGVGGKVVQPFTFADFGEWRIKIPCVTSGFDNLDLNYESLRPNFPDTLALLGSSKGYLGSRANLDYTVALESNPLIEGTARGRVELQSLGSDNYLAQVRTIIKLQ